MILNSPFDVTPLNKMERRVIVISCLPMSHLKDAGFI